MKNQETTNGVNRDALPSGEGCMECATSGGWWFHLRRCAECGHIGCCDSSPGQHATKHFHSTGHPIMASFEPGETWFWSYTLNQEVAATKLHPPLHHPLDQPVPGPQGRVPRDWQSRLH